MAKGSSSENNIGRVTSDYPENNTKYFHISWKIDYIK